MKINIGIIGIILCSLMTGCANYRTNSDIEFDSTDVGDMKPSIPVGPSKLDKGRYTIIERVIAIVKKLSLFHDRPTKEQADIVLAEKGKEKGADAVINVKYDSGVGFDTWGYIEASGDAVKIKK